MKRFRASVVMFVVLTAAGGMAHAGDKLYNGIVPGDKWPPEYKREPRTPVPVPYLKNPPAVMPIELPASCC